MSFAVLTPATGQPLSVLSLRLTLPLRGAWHYTAELDATDDECPAEGAPVRLSMAGRSWSGYVVRSQPWAGRSRVRVEAGVGGMRRTVAGRSYTSALLRTIAGHAITDAGETVAEDADRPDDVLALHVRAEGAAGVALTTALDGTAYGWRFTDAGHVWWGRETWPAASLAGVLELEPFGDDGSTRVAPLAPTLSPGQVWAGRAVERVVYTLSETGLEAELVYRRTATTTGDLRGLLERAVRAAVRELPYLAHYPATVVRQTDAGLELRPDSATIAGPAGAPPARPVYGLPGVRATVPAGSRCGLAFEAGRATEPRAAGWEEGAAAEEIEIEADVLLLGEGASRGVVRTGDRVLGPQIVAVGPVITITNPDGSTVILTDGSGVSQWTVAGTVDPPGRLYARAEECSSTVRAKS